MNIDYHDENDLIRAGKAHQDSLNYRANFRANVANEIEKNPTTADDATFQIAMSSVQSFEENKKFFNRTGEFMQAENNIMNTFF